MVKIKWFLCRIVGKVNFEKYGVEYSKVVENEVPKSTKLSVKKITSFMTPQSHQSMKTTLLEKYFNN